MTPLAVPLKGRDAINRVRPLMAGRPQDADLAVTPYTAGVRG